MKLHHQLTPLLELILLRVQNHCDPRDPQWPTKLATALWDDLYTPSEQATDQNLDVIRARVRALEELFSRQQQIPVYKVEHPNN
ncbi:MAG TPA: hypothetical protein PLY87_28780 [Planctomycetaceae bacterium]|nr:hypothetical protein [Planctomycetaceae bacterium]